MARAVKPHKVVIYADQNGIEPFSEWLYNLKDGLYRQRILSRIRRLEQGNFGDCEQIGEGLSELRLFFGPGYRVYFGREADSIVLLLCGGDKSSQKKDIKRAKTIWQEYVRHGTL